MELVISIAVNALLGIVLLAILYWKGARDHVLLSDATQAMEAFREHFPDAIGIATVAADQRSALIDLQPSQRIGLLQRQGRRWNARLLAPRELSSVQIDENGVLTLTFADFGWPRARIRIAEADSRAMWLARLNSLTGRNASRPHPDLHHA